MRGSPGVTSFPPELGAAARCFLSSPSLPLVPSPSPTFFFFFALPKPVALDCSRSNREGGRARRARAQYLGCRRVYAVAVSFSLLPALESLDFGGGEGAPARTVA